MSATPNVASYYEQNAYVNQFSVAIEAIENVRNGTKPFWTQYVLNPHMKIDDFYYVGVMFFLLIILRFLLSGANHPRAQRWNPLFKIAFSKVVKYKKEAKLTENLWYTCWHLFSFCLGIFVLYTEGLTAEGPGWSRQLVLDWNTKWYWFPTLAEYLNGNLGWPLFPLSTPIRLYYLLELAFWLSCIIYLWMETIRADFHALLLHHIATCSLIFISYICSSWRMGIIILLTHDLADIILYFAKAIHYTKAPPKIVDSFFVAFAIGFFVTRLVLFPLFSLRPALTCCKDVVVDGEPVSHWRIPGGLLMPGFLCVLQMLHIFWFGLILKMVRRSFKAPTSSTGDIRSDNEFSDASPVDDDEQLQENELTSDDSCAKSSLEERERRMKLSSLPGVRATLTKRQLRRSAK